MPSRSTRQVRVECRKWPDSPHWEFDSVLLGTDAHGTWVGIAKGTLLASPVRAFHAAADHVTLVPHDAWWLGTFYGEDPERPFDTYVDITTPAVWLDDEDEFAAHRVSLDYPDDVVEQAVDSCQEIVATMKESAAPFDGATHRAWLARLRADEPV